VASLATTTVIASDHSNIDPVCAIELYTWLRIISHNKLFRVTFNGTFLVLAEFRQSSRTHFIVKLSGASDLKWNFLWIKLNFCGSNGTFMNSLTHLHSDV